MNIKQILIAVITILILAAAGIGIFALYISKNASQQPSTTEDQTNGGASVQVPEPTQTQTSAVSEQELDAAYSVLFAKIGAQKIKFTTVSGSAGEQGSVYALYSSDIAYVKKFFPKLTTFPMSIALLDLNKDGVTEAVVWENLPGICGTAGCPLEIYTKSGGKWNLVYSGLSGSIVGLGTTYTNGYADFFSPISGDVGYQSKIVRYSWNSSAYAPNGVIATWDGNEFLQ